MARSSAAGAFASGEGIIIGSSQKDMASAVSRVSAAHSREKAMARALISVQLNGMAKRLAERRRPVDGLPGGGEFSTVTVENFFPLPSHRNRAGMKKRLV